ncbi:MAG: spore maturation protein [Gloeocapsa sp. DLM2.Bin57]|nr:MAG: spore maturation protein [Gloeocapsa sp. DLM2.Bin57]
MPKTSAINTIFVAFLVIAIIVGAGGDRLAEVTEASFEAAKNAVTLAINLIGVMALWLGLVRVLEAGGLMYTIAKLLKPIMLHLFPDVPPNHPAMGAITLNFAANFLGLGNAATPLGIKTMLELNKLNPTPGVATNAMCLFLAINTSSLTLFPLTVIGIRAATNATNPAAIWLPTLLSTLISTIVAIVVCFSLTWNSQVSPIQDSISSEAYYLDNNYQHLLSSPSRVGRICAWLFVIAFLIAVIFNLGRQNWLETDILSHLLIPALILLIIAYGVAKGVKVYEAVTEGAKQGFEVAISIIPFLVAILVAIAMFRASGAMDILINLLDPYTNLINMPPETLPMALIRPLSGSGALGVMTELLEQSPDSYPAFVASVMMGSTETTFYVLAVYFGSVGIINMRHAIIAGLLADLAGLLSACFWSSIFFS